MATRVLEENLNKVTEDEFRKFLDYLSKDAIKKYVQIGICQILPSSSDYIYNDKKNIKGKFWRKHFINKATTKDFQDICVDEVYHFKDKEKNVLNTFTLLIYTCLDLVKPKKNPVDLDKLTEGVTEEGLEEAIYQGTNAFGYDFLCRLFDIPAKQERLDSNKEKELDEKIKKAEDKLDEALDRVYSLEEEIKDKDRKIKKLEKDLDVSKVNNNNKKEEIDKLNANISDYKKEIEKLRKELVSSKASTNNELLYKEEKSKSEYNIKLANIIKRLDVSNELTYLTDSMSNTSVNDLKEIILSNLDRLQKEISDENIDSVKRNLLVTYVLASVIGDEL